MTIKGYGKATREIIKEYEQYIGFDLPNDYISFLVDFNGGTIKDGAFYVSEINEKIPLHVLYGLNVDIELDLKKWNDEYMDDILPNSLIIGYDYGGEFIVLINGPELKGVYYWDHMFYFEQSKEESNTYFIANSFADFLDMLNNQS